MKHWTLNLILFNALQDYIKNTELNVSILHENIYYRLEHLNVIGMVLPLSH